MDTSARRTGEEGEALVKRFRESGLTQRAFAESAGIKVCTLQYWLRKVAEGRDSVGGRFVELKPGMCKEGPVSLTVQIGADVTMRFQALPPPSYLAELSREMRTC